MPDELYTKTFNIPFEERQEPDPSLYVLQDRVDAEEDMVYGLFIKFFHTFATAGGLRAMMHIIAPEKLAEIAQAIPGSSLAAFKLPLDFVASLLSSLRSVKTIAKKEAIHELALIGKKTFIERVQALEEKDIKDLSRDRLVSAIKLMRSFLKLEFTDEEAAKTATTCEMLLSLKLLQSPYLEKRLHGIADIKRIIEQVDNLDANSAYLSPPKSSWLSPEYLVGWVVKNGIPAIILNENAHAELVKRASYILAFLAKHGAMTTSLLELLWKCQLDKHEDIVRAIYDVIKDVVEYLSFEASLEQLMGNRKLASCIRNFRLCRWMSMTRNSLPS